MTKIPKNAKLVFEGICFKIYQWEQEMFDGTYQTFEAAKRADNAQILTTLNNKIILIKEMQPHFKEPIISLPGGNVDFGETAMDAAIRETFEETGIECDDLELIAQDKPGSRLDRTFHLFIAHKANKITTPKQTRGEHIELLQLDFEDFVKETQKPNFRNHNLKNIIKEMLHNKKELENFKKKLFNQ